MAVLDAGWSAVDAVVVVVVVVVVEALTDTSITEITEEVVHEADVVLAARSAFPGLPLGVSFALVASFTVVEVVGSSELGGITVFTKSL